jgi:hypothetical protein
MRDRIIIAVAVLFIGACAIFVFLRISSHYSAPDGGTIVPSPPPLVPSATASATATTAAAPVSTTARPRRTRTVWVTVTAGGTDGQ